VVFTPPLEDEEWPAGENDPHAWQAEVMDVVADRALAAGLIRVTEEAQPDGSVAYTTEVLDEEGLSALTAQVIAELAHGETPAALGLSRGGRYCAIMMDRMLNHGITDPEAAMDITPPYITPRSPLPDQTIFTRRPVISAEFEDPEPSSGLDICSLAVYVDGRALVVTVPEGSAVYVQTLPYDLSPGYHRIVIEISDLLGQRRRAEWRFLLAE